MELDPRPNMKLDFGRARKHHVAGGALVDEAQRSRRSRRCLVAEPAGRVCCHSRDVTKNAPGMAVRARMLIAVPPSGVPDASLRTPTNGACSPKRTETRARPVRTLVAVS